MNSYRLILLLSLGCAAVAQQTVAPTPERVGEPRGSDYDGYNIVQSWEVGYRFHTVDGNEGTYRSDVNFGNGIRLLGAHFSMNSKNGHGKLFDELTFTAEGLGNDPYESATLRLLKNHIYSYDMLWRQNALYNPALPISFGEHLMDTTRTMQDHDFTLFPQSKFRFFAGFSRNVQDGPALTTVQLFNSTGSEFALFADIHRIQNEYRAGNEFQLFGFRVNWMYALERYKEGSPSSLPAPETMGGVTVQQFSRTEPYTGDTPSWRVNLFREHSKLWALNGRFTNSSGRRNYTFNESAVGADRFAAQNQQIIVGGNAARPVTTAQLNLSLFPTESLTFTNSTGFYNTRMNGNSTFSLIDNSIAFETGANFQYLSLRSITNATDLNWHLSNLIQIHGGYQYAARNVRSTEQAVIEGFPFTIEGAQDNHVNAGVAGVRLQPLKPLTVALDGEIGRQDHPFYPISDKNYDGFSGRAMWKQKSFRLSAVARAYTNVNSVSLAAYSARNRQYSFDGSWNPRDWFSLDAGYSKLHLNTAAWISYFVALQPVTGDQSIYISNLHAVHFQAHFSFRQRVDLFVGYSRTQDTGDGRVQLDTPPAGSPQGASLAAFRAVQTFPMIFDSPQARLSIRIIRKLRWNIGYQRYGYSEELLPSQNYRAETGYTSLLWTF